MKIKYNMIPEKTLSEFADEHDLVLEVNERSTETLQAFRHLSNKDRFYTHFVDSEIKGIGVLISAFGNGETVDEAIEEYRKEISEKTLVVNAGSANRKEIKVPRLLKEYQNDAQEAS